MKKKCFYTSGIIGICIICLVFFIVNKFEHKKIPAYRFQSESMHQQIYQWLENKETPFHYFEDYDICFMRQQDTLWDKNYRFVIDTFNLRIHTHTYGMDSIRDHDFANWIIGVCNIGYHHLFIYDTCTLHHLFVPTRTNAHVMLPVYTTYSIGGLEHEYLAYMVDIDSINFDITDSYNYYSIPHYFMEYRDFQSQTNLFDEDYSDSFSYLRGPLFLEDTTVAQTINRIQSYLQNQCVIASDTYLILTIFVDCNGHITHIETDPRINHQIANEITNALQKIPPMIPPYYRGIPQKSQLTIKLKPSFPKFS